MIRKSSLAKAQAIRNRALAKAIHEQAESIIHRQEIALVIAAILSDSPITLGEYRLIVDDDRLLIGLDDEFYFMGHKVRMKDES
jgi:hypothetical protein